MSLLHGSLLAFCDTPVGTLRIVGTDNAVSRILFPHEVLPDLPDTPPVQQSSAALDACVQQLREYFAGQRTRFDLSLASDESAGFHARVREELTRVGFGQRLTYSQLAVLAGNPRATRAAGSACARNPLPIVVPCHRIIRSDGTLGNYRGGNEAKTFLLDFEAQRSRATAPKRAALEPQFPHSSPISQDH